MGWFVLFVTWFVNFEALLRDMHRDSRQIPQKSLFLSLRIALTCFVIQRESFPSQVSISHDTVPSAIWSIFSELLIFYWLLWHESEVTPKYKKEGNIAKYLLLIIYHLSGEAKKTKKSKNKVLFLITD